MSTIEVVNHITLDGVMQAPAHPDEDRRGGFEHGGWAPPYSDEVQGEYMGARMSRGGGSAAARALDVREVRGRLAEAAGGQPDPPGARGQHQVRRVAVAPRELGWQNSVLLEGDAVETVADLKAREDGDIVILGSGELVQALLPHGLIDAFLLTIHPLVLGSGRRLFGDDGALAKFKLVESKPTTTGVLITRYEAA